jgi:hypothetical protein
VHLRLRFSLSDLGLLTNAAGYRSVRRQALGPRRLSPFRELLGHMLAGPAIHLVRRLALECGVGELGVVFADIEIDKPTERLVLHHDSIVEFENAISVCARTRRRMPELMSSSIAAVRFSTPASVKTVGGSSVLAVALPASTRTSRVMVGSKCSETRQARILREKLSMTA